MLLSFDLSGADWSTTAYCCRDTAMLEVVRSKKSPHPITASRMFGVSVDDIMVDHKLIGNKIDPVEIANLRKEHIPLVLEKASFVPRAMSMRQAGKKAGHGCNFREGFRTFALKNEMEEREARQIVTLYRDKAYPGLKTWYNALDDKIRKDRTLENCFGRKVYFQGALNDDTFRAATSFIPQSTTFDVCGAAMRRFNEDETPDFAPAQMVAQVHDSLIWDYRSRDFSAMSRFCRKIAFDYMSPELCYHGETYRLDVTLKSGPTWGSMQETAIDDTLESALAKHLTSKACI